jgi:hypothetical protein
MDLLMVAQTLKDQQKPMVMSKDRLPERVIVTLMLTPKAQPMESQMPKDQLPEKEKLKVEQVTEYWAYHDHGHISNLSRR